MLDSGKQLPSPDGILINGKGPNGASFTVEQGEAFCLYVEHNYFRVTLTNLIIP
jgi:hypothetical protein